MFRKTFWALYNLEEDPCLEKIFWALPEEEGATL